MNIVTCNACRKQCKTNSGVTFVSKCINCTLKSNKAMLLKCFQAIVDQSEMKQFRDDMEQWYV